MNDPATVQFTHFLSRLPGAHEVSLALAQDTQTQRTLIETLNNHSFTPLSSILDYGTARGATYLIVKDVSKPVYDFICQYPLTVITLSDPQTKHTVTFHSRYDTPFLLLMTEAVLRLYEAQGLDILGRTGMAYRTPPENK